MSETATASSEVDRIGLEGGPGEWKARLGRARVSTLADVESERVRWLWSDRIARGKLNGTVGNGGLGKSTVLIDLTARVSAGFPMPDGAKRSKPSDVVILSAEDGVADTIKPRLEAAGGDATRVHVVEAVERDGFDVLPTLPDDLDDVRAVVEATEAALLVVDPWSAYLPGDTNSHRDADVRRALAPLADMADETGVAVELVAHLNKSTNQDPLHRIVGSVAMGAALRQVKLVTKDPDNPDDRVLAQLKSNLAPRAEPLGYRLESAPEHGCASVAWTGPSDHQLADLLGQGGSKPTETGRDRAVRVLRSLLVDGPLPSTDVKSEAAELSGTSERNVKRARESSEIESSRWGGPGGDGQWYWHLPGDWPPEEGDDALLI